MLHLNVYNGRVRVFSCCGVTSSRTGSASRPGSAGDQSVSFIAGKRGDNEFDGHA